MQHLFKETFLLLLIISELFAVSHNALAVLDNGNGEIVSLTLENSSNLSGAYVSIYPYSGTMLQESLRNSITHLNLTKDIKSNGLILSSNIFEQNGSLDGPSAGVLLSLMLEEIYRNITINDKLSITGGIDSEGNIIPVGGLLEKYEAGHSSNLSGILVPPLSDIERVQLCRLYLEYKTPIHEYSSYEEAKNLMTSENISYYLKQIDNDMTTVDNLTAVYPNNMVNEYVNSMIAEGKARVNNINCYKEYFEDKINLSEQLLSKGYSYSAGNEMFLSLNLLRSIDSRLERSYLEDRYNRTKKCIKFSLNSLSKCESDPMLYAQSELRIFWANSTLSEVKIDKNLTKGQILESLYKVERANLWCNFSLYIEQACKSNGPKVDHESWRREIEKELLSNNESTLNRDILKSSIAYRQGYYGAALVELAYAYSEHTPPVNKSGDKWVNMLRSHGKYLNNSDKNSAESINNLALWMDYLIFKSNPHQSKNVISGHFTINMFIYIIYSVIVILVIYCLILSSKMKKKN